MTQVNKSRSNPVHLPVCQHTTQDAYLYSMKWTPLLLGLIASVTLQAQITITSNEMPDAGDTLRFSNANPTSVDVVPTGANFNWDFSNLVHTSQGLDEYVNSITTPYAFFFFGTYGLKIADTIGIGTFSLTNVHTFFDKTSTKYTAEGAGLSYNGLPIPANYSDPDEIYTLPLDFNDYDSTTYKVSFTLTTLLNLVQQGTRVNEVDGWGSIITPYGTFDCLRVKSTLYERDSISISGIGTSFPVIRQEYRWLTTTEHFPILEVTGTLAAGNFVAGQVRYRDNFRNDTVSTGLVTLDNETRLDLYPNPSSESATLSIGRDWQQGRAVLYDLNGQAVGTWESLEEHTQLSFEALPRGVYLLQIETGGARNWRKVVLE